jgi:hypothetical protein
MNLRGGKSTLTLLAACSAAAIVVAACPAKAQTCPTQPPTQTIKIYNDSTGTWLFPELEVGIEGPDKGNIWMQAICKVPNSKIGELKYARTQTNRFYINPTKGIAPGASVEITLPLFTQLVASVDPKMPNQYAEWWQGQNMQVFTSTSATPPEALQENYNGNLRGGQSELKSDASNPTWPTCASPCELKFFKDTAGTLGKENPSQLLEATLGARQELKVVNDSPPNKLDVANADFDVSYVNLAYTGAAMGPYQNDQVGYVGTPMIPGTFTDKLLLFEKDFPDWPRFVINYKDKTKETVQKLPAPLEVLARLTGASPPTDLTPIPDVALWPKKVWPPIQKLRDDFALFTSLCSHSVTGDTFCDALLDAHQIIIDNYQNYQKLFKDKVCKGTPVDDTPDAVLAHVYGWAPWVEAKEGTATTGCKPADNLLENTPTYKDNSYKKYLRVKLEFDNLQYNKYANPPYVFDPWVELIHGKNYLNIPGAYAYSVDDAVGNIQAEAKGYIVDFGGLKHLENDLPAAPPITINLGGATTLQFNYKSYFVCSDDPKREKPVDPLNRTFIISANAPQKCPVYLTDDKNPAQMYTFTLTQPPPFMTFTLEQKDKGVPRWSNTIDNTTSVIKCDGNKGFAESSKTWCCNLKTSSGVWAYSYPEPNNPHKLYNNVVDAGSPAQSRNSGDVQYACSMGK